MSLNNRYIGLLGENIAAEYLRKHKYRILFRNYKTRVGEIDVIAQKEDKVSFLEVKTRVGLSHGYPHKAIDYRKIRHMKRAADWFLLQNNFKNYKLSLDVISIVLNEDKSVSQLKFFENIVC